APLASMIRMRAEKFPAGMVPGSTLTTSLAGAVALAGFTESQDGAGVSTCAATKTRKLTDPCAVAAATTSSSCGAGASPPATALNVKLRGVTWTAGSLVVIVI